jgi:hypothetical protein
MHTPFTNFRSERTEQLRRGKELQGRDKGLENIVGLQDQGWLVVQEHVPHRVWKWGKHEEASSERVRQRGEAGRGWGGAGGKGRQAWISVQR